MSVFTYFYKQSKVFKNKMKNLEIKPSSSTPAVMFLKTGILIISGRSMAEDSAGFYQPIIDRMKEFIGLNHSIQITVEMEYVNTASSKMLLELLKIPIEANIPTTITWNYEEDDDDHLDLGKYYEEILGVEFNFRMVQNFQY